MMTLGTVGLGNVQSAKFKNADRWWQVPLDEREHWLDRVGSGGRAGTAEIPPGKDVRFPRWLSA